MHECESAAYAAHPQTWSSLSLEGTMRQAPEAEAQREEEAAGRSQDTEIRPGERQAFGLARVGRRGGGLLRGTTTTAARALLEPGDNVARASITFITA
jgi:hypothetical protein